LNAPFDINEEFDTGLIDPEWKSSVQENKILK
jgi:hypothetical protein